MLVLSKDLISKNILSLRANMPIASVKSCLINPNNLKIEAFYCNDRFDKKPLLLLVQDIRDVIDNGYIVNDHDVLTPPEDLIRLRELIELNFNLINKQVETVTKYKVGKVYDFATEIGSMFIQKLYVNQPIYKNLNGGGLVVDRTQIAEITPRRIIIEDINGLVSSTAKAGITA